MASPSATPKIGKYNVLDVIGEGGMGIVYKAVDPKIGRLVAIKKMTERFRQDEAVLQRFYREAQAAGTLQHPNIVTIYDLGDDDGNAYIVMEYLNGQSLERLIESGQPLPMAQKLDFIIQICSALHYAHQQGVVHRDIKPANVIVQPNGSVKLLDFGIAHTVDKGLTRTGQIIGTLNYISPEQLNGAPVDGRADIFATGAMMFQLLTGHLPFDAPQTAAIITRILHHAVPSLGTYLSDYPVELDRILQRATAKDCNQRYRTADDFGLELAGVKERLDREAIDECLDEARARIVAADLTGARNLLSQVLKLDIQNPSAIQAMADVQRLLEQNENNQRIQQLRSEAQEAFAGRKFTEAMERISAAINIAKTDPDLLSFREVIQQEMVRKEQAGKLQQLAEAARKAGQLEIAKKVIDDALQADPHNTQAQLFRASIATAIETEAKEREFRELIEHARNSIASRHFTEAQGIILKAEALEPNHRELAAIKEVAQTGAAQEKQRREIELWCHEVEEFLDAADYDSAFRHAELGLKKFPADPVLVRQKAQAESLQLLAKREREVFSCVAEIEGLLKAGNLKDAVEMASGAVRRFPTDPRLQSALEESLREVKEKLGQEAAAELSPFSQPPLGEAPRGSAVGENPTMDFSSQQVVAVPAAFGNSDSAETVIGTSEPPEPKPAAPEVEPEPEVAEVEAVVAPAAVPVAAPAPVPALTAAPALIGKPARAPSRAGMMIAAVVMLVVVVGVATAVKFWPRHKPVPQQAAVPASVNLAIDAIPWATVVEVRPQGGTPIPVNKATPVLVVVPAGDYAIQMKGPDGVEHIGQLRVEAGQPARYVHEFQPVDVEKLLESYR
ncbi:MAG TPA: protein kinase [Terriglobales bacterium]|nr:protein kinase [Terriglobales bacterium]